MIKFNLALYLLIAVLFTSCALTKALTKNYIVMDKYQQAEIKGKYIGVIVNNVTVNNPDHIRSIKDEQPEEFIRAYFRTKIKNYLLDMSLFRKGKSLDVPEENILVHRTLTLNDGSIVSVQIPQDGVKLEFKNFKADYVLFVDEVICSETKGKPGTWEYKNDPLLSVSSQEYRLKHFDDIEYKVEPSTLNTSCDYVIWDNVVGEIASFGRAEEVSPFYSKIEYANLKECALGLSKQIVFRKPFKKKKMPNFY